MLHYWFVSGEYKRIERLVAEYIGPRYRTAVEVGIGDNPHAARILANNGLDIVATDIKTPKEDPGVPFFHDDLCSPDLSRYTGKELLYSIRPGEEMIAPLLALARETGCDLLVYHLGFEGFHDPGELVECGVVLHLYRKGYGTGIATQVDSHR